MKKSDHLTLVEEMNAAPPANCLVLTDAEFTAIAMAVSFTMSYGQYYLDHWVTEEKDAIAFRKHCLILQYDVWRELFGAEHPLTAPPPANDDSASDGYDATRL